MTVAIGIERGGVAAAPKAAQISGAVAARVQPPPSFAIADVKIIRGIVVDDQDVRVTITVGIERGDALALSRVARIPGSAAARVDGPAALAIAKVQVIRLTSIDDQNVRVAVAIGVERGDTVAPSFIAQISGPTAARVDTPAAVAIAKPQIIRQILIDDQDIDVTVAVGVERGDTAAA